MKYTLSLIAAIGVITMASAPAFAGDVVINLEGVETAKGDLYVGLQTKDQFLKDAGTNGAIIKAPKSGPQTVVLKDVAPGDYSVSVWHDIDGDMKFSRADNGMPLDGWSMIGAQDLRGAPTWESAKFSVTDGTETLSLKMVYSKK
jgi:uncharacterized protein (DUF2141 family)